MTTTGSALITFSGVTKQFGKRVAVDDVGLVLRSGTTLGIVGESGSGKTTCARLMLGLLRPTAGMLEFEGAPYPRSRRGLRAFRRNVGTVFQDPYDSLDPRMTLLEIVAEPLQAHGLAKGKEATVVREMLDVVGLPDAPLDSHPSSYSGGGRQRIAIARGLVHDPSVLVCDEPTASLDVSVQAQILNLLLALKQERSVTTVFVSHDLDLVRRISDDVVVMYAGRVVESGRSGTVATTPRHPYTAQLLAAVPGDHPARRKLQRGAPGGMVTPTADEVARGGCVFAGRCPRVADLCREVAPASTSGRTDVACHFPLDGDGAQSESSPDSPH